MGNATIDFLVSGGGIIGVSVARELRRVYPISSVVVLEKEPKLGLHASGRNSGVLHPEFYYTADSLKARFLPRPHLCRGEKINWKDGVRAIWCILKY